MGVNIMTVLKPKDVAKRLGVTTRTLQSWDRKGILKAKRSPTNRRFYTEDQIKHYLDRDTAVSKRKQVAYARVSTYGQKDDLKDQLSYIRQYVNAKGIILDKEISDIGSGLNYKRPKWNKLLEEVMQGKIDKIYITYKDRFIRFGYDWFDNLCKSHGTEIVVLNNVDTSPDKELVEDLVSIIHVFSCRLYGLRKYKKKIKGEYLSGNQDTSSKAESK